ncbi:MAG: hypothetical protein PWQ10_79 [Patescibacteria group bacterium]|nr:hypothetical protein [Patescibacteria group bacterium]
MGAIIMLSTTSMLLRLKNSYPQFLFKEDTDFFWSSSDNTIFYDASSKDLPVLILHELSHALLGHNKYDSDIQLISMERQAWEYTIKLAYSFNIKIPDEIIQSNLDSYRSWLYCRSTCPKCQSIGLQVKAKTYHCLACNHSWQVNEARKCNLRRYNQKNN